MSQINLAIAVRRLAKNRLFTFLNVTGLASGLAVVLLIGLWIKDELSYDCFHEHADRIYRINYDVQAQGMDESYAVSPAPMGPTFVREYPAVEAFCRFRQRGFIGVKKGEESIEEGSNVYVDSSFFQVFSFPLLEGDPKKALVEPNTVVISEKMAQKYFGASTGIVGRTLLINEYMPRRVTGVMREWPSQSHFTFDFLFSMSTIDEAKSDVWLSNNFQTYLLLRPNVSASQFPPYFEELMQKYFMPQLYKITGITADSLKAQGDRLEYSLQNVRDIHLHSDRIAEHEANSDMKYLWIFGSVALAVLLLACVNFMNLSTARSSTRAREVGVRKALGSARGALVRQFLTESALLTVLAFALALGAVWAVLPYFNQFSEKNIAFSWQHSSLWAGLVGLAMITALVAGSYPALFLSSFRPIEVLRGKWLASGAQGGAVSLRSGLVIFQFCVSVALISAVWVVQQQLSFIQNKKLGWDKEQVMMLRNTWFLRGRTLDFKDRLKEIPGIERVSAADYFPTPSPRNSLTIGLAGSNPGEGDISSQLWEVDFDYKDVFGLEMKEGRWFDPQLSTDSVACVINEAALKAFGWSDPLGRKLETFIDPSLNQKIQVEVAGVVKNFHYESLRENIEPIVMIIGRSSGTMALRLSPQADVEKTVAAVGQVFKKYLPAQPFNYRFLDDEFDKQYRTEHRIGAILGTFAGIAILIACLGLFGLATFMAEQRTKEIGIRKVLGASVASVTSLLAKDFLKLVLVAILIAGPLAYYLMQKWLTDFAYRIDLHWWTFAAAGLLAILIAALTVGAQSMRAALANPVRSLKNE